MSETIIAPVKRWAELHLEVGDYVKGDVQKPIYMASTEQIEYLLIKFAQAHVQKALNTAKESVNQNVVPNCSHHTPFWGECTTCGRHDNPELIRDIDKVKESIEKAYPLDNIK